MTKTEATKALRAVIAGDAPVPTEPKTLAALLRVASATRIGVLSRMIESDELWEKACDIKWGSTVSHVAS